MRTWKPMPWGECPKCGDGIEVKTDCDTLNHAYDGDRAQCTHCDCMGTVIVDDNSHAYVSWDDYEDDEDEGRR